MSKNNHVGLFFRLKTLVNILAAFRIHEFRAAKSLINKKYKDYSLPVALVKLVGWSLEKMWVTIPNAMPWMSEKKPVSKKPFWLESKNPLYNYPWEKNLNSKLPEFVDTLVIGAGFTGASAAYYWSKNAPEGRNMLVLEMGEAADGASGRNQGTIVMGRFFAMVRDTVKNHLKFSRPDLTTTQQKHLAEQFADVYCSAAEHNAELIKQTITDEKFDVDYHRKGWIQEHSREQQDRLKESVAAGIEHGHTDWVAIDPEEVFKVSGMKVDYPAGFSKGAATWHPAKWVWSLLETALKNPNVQFYSRTKVLKVSSDENKGYRIETDRGVVYAKNVLYANESYLPKLDTEFHNVIIPSQEQLSSGIGYPQDMPTDNSISGWFYFGTRRDNVLFMGSDSTHLPDKLAGNNNPSRFLTKFAFSEYLRVYGPFNFTLTNEWSGTTGYTPDEFPIVGSVDNRGKYVIAGMTGSGSGVAFNAARCIVNRILNITDEPDDYPEEYFSPSRLLSPNKHKWPQIKNN